MIDLPRIDAIFPTEENANELFFSGSNGCTTALGDLSSALSDLEGGERRGEVRSLRVPDSEAGAVEVPTTTVVSE